MEDTKKQLKKLIVVMVAIITLAGLSPIVFYYQSYTVADCAMYAAFGVVLSFWIFAAYGICKLISYAKHSAIETVTNHQAMLSPIVIEREKLWSWRFASLAVLGLPLIAFAIGSAIGGAILGCLMSGTSLYFVYGVLSHSRERKQISQVKIAEVKAYREKEDREITPQCPLD